MRAGENEKYNEVLKRAWDKFQINFTLNLFENDLDGVEVFGFGTRYKDDKVEERLINELPLLRYFIQEFRNRHTKLFAFLADNSVDLSSEMGNAFYVRPSEIILPFDRSSFLREIDCNWIVDLTPREKDILKLVACGFPASYIKEKLYLGIRTVENYIANIKAKLNCHTKVELIKKAQKIASTGILDH